MPRVVESFAIGKQNPVRVRRVVPHVCQRSCIPPPGARAAVATHRGDAFRTDLCRDRVLIGRADLPPNQPAIDRDDRSRHIIGQVGSKELDHLGTILDSSEPTKGNQLGSIPITRAGRIHSRTSTGITVSSACPRVGAASRGRRRDVLSARNDRRHDPSGRDYAGRDAVHRDSERPEILRQIPRVMCDSGLPHRNGISAIGGRGDPGD